VIHWVLDLFPDVLTVAGRLRPGGWGEAALRALVRRTFEGAAANVFLGRRLRAHAETRFGEIPRALVIPVGADGAPFHGREPAERTGVGTRVLYCGNLGRMHDVTTIAAALAEGLPAGLKIEFRGNGPGFRDLETGIGGRAGVSFGGNLPAPEWVPAMLAADVALVTMRRGAEGVVMPSKTYSALVAGQAVLAVCPRQSDLADLVREHGCGWVVEPGDVAGLREALRLIASSPREVLLRRRAAYEAGHRAYDQSVIAVAWERLLREVVGGRSRE
jgi:glycosyltransferase involved in cell wall biosynthesis